YFIMPLVNVAIGMLVLGERQNRVQLVAIAIACVAIAILAVGVGHLPFISLGLAGTFAAYGYIHKIVPVSSTSSVGVEMLLLAPLGLIYLIATGSFHIYANPTTLGLLLLTGPLTVAPLVLFGYSAQRLRMTTMGMLQYVSPSISFVVAIAVFHEPLNLTQ